MAPFMSLWVEEIYLVLSMNQLTIPVSFGNVAPRRIISSLTNEIWFANEINEKCCKIISFLWTKLYNQCYLLKFMKENKKYNIGNSESGRYLIYEKYEWTKYMEKNIFNLIHMKVRNETFRYLFYSKWTGSILLQVF